MESITLKLEEDDAIIDVEEDDTNTTDERNILHTIAIKCIEEMESNCLQKPLEDYIGRVAYYTGLPRENIQQAIISKNLDDFDHNNKYFNLNDLKEIFKYIADLYTNNKMPTYKTIYNWYKSKNAGMTYFQFQYMLHCLGFDYHKTELGKEILMEDPSLTYQRYLYLKKIKNLRSKNAPIYYIDERFFDSTFTFPKPWLKNIDISSTACDGYVFFHAISKQGLLNGFFCCPATKKDFRKWIYHLLMPLLMKPSVIVMDNNYLHGTLTKTVTKYHSKNDMLQYLRLKNIPCSEYMHKAELYDLITKCTFSQESYDIDEMLKAHGHIVLRLPAYFHNLSMTQFLWEYLLVSDPTLFVNVDLSQIKILLVERLKSLSEHVWENFHQTLLTNEKEILEIDLKAHKALEDNNMYKIN